MYYSITFLRPEDVNVLKSTEEIKPYLRNTYTDWSLVPTSRPGVAPPTPKTVYVDIPGANSQLDFSTTLTGYPVYQNRTGSWNFMIDREHTNRSWNEIYSEVMDWIQGREMCCYLEDDQSWYYKGRFHVSSLESDGKYTTIQIDYNLYPYKRSSIAIPNSDKWIWDTFDFVDGIIPNDMIRGISVNSEEYVNVMFPTKNIEEWYTAFGSEPVIPIIRVSSTNGIDIKFQNKSLNKPEVEVHLNEGDHKIRNIIFGGRCLNLYTPEYYSGTNWKMGDANGDGKINSVDASIILSKIADVSSESYEFTTKEKAIYDVNQDGKITGADATFILTKMQYGDYTLTSDATMSLQVKGVGTISFIFIPGRL